MSALNRSRSGGGKKKGSSRRKRMSGGIFNIGGGSQLVGSPYSQAGGNPDSNPMEGMTGPGDNTFGGSDPADMIKNLLKSGGMGGAEGMFAPMAAAGGGHTRRLRKRSGRARHHRTKSYSAGGKKGRKTRRRHRRRH